MNDVSLRRATEDDAAWIFSQVPRLHEFGPPSWRSVDQMNAGEIRDLGAGLQAAGDPERLFLIAEVDGVRSGFLFLTTQTDFFTGERHGHISDIVVSAEGEGRGVGRRLMDAATAWSREAGHRFLTLTVFPENRRAVALYERQGFRTDVMRMLKVHEAE